MKKAFSLSSDNFLIVTYENGNKQVFVPDMLDMQINSLNKQKEDQIIKMDAQIEQFASLKKECTKLQNKYVQEKKNSLLDIIYSVDNNSLVLDDFYFKMTDIALKNINPNLRAFLLMIQRAEGTYKFTNPYHVIVGGGQFTDYSKHPDIY